MWLGVRLSETVDGSTLLKEEVFAGDAQGGEVQEIIDAIKVVAGFPRTPGEKRGAVFNVGKHIHGD